MALYVTGNTRLMSIFARSGRMTARPELDLV